MNIYFTYSQDLSDNIISQISEALKNFGYEVSKKAIPENPNKMSVKESEQVFVKSLKDIQNCDILVAEVSHVCMGVAYEISQALEQRKPVLVLCNLEENNNSKNDTVLECIPPHIKGNTSKYLILKEYTARTLQKTIELGLKDAKTMVNSKFLLIIPHEIDVYLEWCVKERGMSKAAATREALKMVMKGNQDFVNHLDHSSKV